MRSGYLQHIVDAPVRKSMSLPNLFIVGAPKCGTTALYQYLRQHPEVFMSAVKEPHFFGSDLQSTKFIRDRSEYAALFSEASGYQFVGEASVYYLYSKHAAEEIHASNPSASIIIMLRNPVDMVYSLHSQAVSSGNETIVDFAEALRAEAERSRGRGIPDIADFPQGLLYCDIARYAQQVNRYLDIFGPDSVKIILFDDFVRHPEQVFRETLEFVGVADTTFQPTFEKVNPNRRLRSVALEHFLKRRTTLRQALKRAAPTVYSTLYSMFQRMNAVLAKRNTMPAHLRAELCEQFTPEAQELSRIIGHDLTAWLQADKSISDYQTAKGD